MKKYAILLLSFLILTACESDDPIQYELSTQANPPEGGTISPSSGTFEEGKEITFKATPSEEYVFKNWSDDASGDENPMVAVMTDDMFVTANFEKKTYALTIEIIGKGTVKEEVIQAKSSTDYPSGTQVQLTAFPDEGWEFEIWDAIQEMWVEEENPMVLDMYYHHKVTAVFKPLNEEKVYIPDDNFEQALIDLDLDYGYVPDNYVYAEYIKDVEVLILENKGIEDLTGIEGFIGLKSLICSNNNIHSLDLTSNAQLDALDADNNKLETIDLSQNRDLFVLKLNGNDLRKIDLSKTESLTFLDLSDNKLESLDLSALNHIMLLANNNMFSCVTVNEDQLKFIDQYLACDVMGMCWRVDSGVEFALDCDN